MKQAKFLFLAIVAVIGLAACNKKENVSISNDAQLKPFHSEAQLREAFNPFLTGYVFDPRFFQFNDLNNAPHDWTRYYTGEWIRFIPQREGLFSRLYLFAGTTPRPVTELLNDPYEVIIKDPRLGKAPYRNVYITRGFSKNKAGWVYSMYLDFGNTFSDSGTVQFVDLQYTLSSNYLEDLAVATEPPTNEEIITLLLNLTEPVPWN